MLPNESHASSSKTEPPTAPPSHADVHALREEIRQLRTMLAAQQAGGEDHAARLVSLYVAVNSVHSALDQASVLAAVRDVVTTLIGSEEMALFEVHGGEGQLTLLASEGIDPRPYQALRLGEGIIGTVAATGEPFIAPAAATGDTPHAQTLAACVPLKLGERVVGVLAIYRLLPQKDRLDASDLDLLDALTAHVARALIFARLYATSGAGASM